MPGRHPSQGVPEGYEVIRVRDAPKTPWIRRMRRAGWRTTKLLIVLFVFFYIGASVYMGATIGNATREVPQVQSQVGPRYEDVSFQAWSDGLYLKGWLFHADHPSGRSVIFIAGWGSTRVNAISIPVAHDLLNHGYDVLLFDGRGSGQSQGSRQTLGNLEQHDVLGAYAYMKAHGYSASRMVVFGVSAGGSAALMAAPQMADVGAVVTDSAFAELHPLLDAGWSQRTHLPGATDWLGIQVGKYLDINPDLSPAGAVTSNPKRAFLFFHARGDGLVPVAHAEELKQASANAQSQLLVTQGTQHMDTYAQNPPAYLAALYAFLDQQIAAHGG